MTARDSRLGAAIAACSAVSEAACQLGAAHLRAPGDVPPLGFLVQLRSRLGRAPATSLAARDGGPLLAEGGLGRRGHVRQGLLRLRCARGLLDVLPGCCLLLLRRHGELLLRAEPVTGPPSRYPPGGPTCLAPAARQIYSFPQTSPRTSSTRSPLAGRAGTRRRFTDRS